MAFRYVEPGTCILAMVKDSPGNWAKRMVVIGWDGFAISEDDQTIYPPGNWHTF